ncbi:ABC transporter ATP-binding protein [Oryzicola mucosus]|uniref:ABC transporter ATP-binding protein n=1 Tax=Oryzicola mucosus TaxID=2767425 RepID=A0A8J6U975_9HYPH|nr:ABC transporter ATP-binding protein [Oryzicola mucosus]MBD0416757.1 ABC transporter ATP-binding protein [Oryzicola mucosus]
MTHLFQAFDITKKFAGLVALDQVSFHLDEGEILGLIGPNGAGKSTCFNVITGTLKPTSGRIELREQDITGMPPYLTAHMGLARTFQHTTVFQHLTVRENIEAACWLRSKVGLGCTLLRTSSYRSSEISLKTSVDDILSMIDLRHVQDSRAKGLPYGYLRRLGIGIALGTNPALLLMDEPAAGLNPTESAEFSKLARRLRDFGITIVIVEHDMKVIMGLCDRIVVLNYGKKIAEGSPGVIRRDPQVIESYLGKSHDEAETARA